MNLLACAVENNPQITQITQSYSLCLQQAGRSDNEYFTSPPSSFQRKLACMDAGGRAASGTGRRGIQWLI